ncbi:hypothetical protein H0H87_012873 [Tephrocybe sp. NHM501043]|nr:hypothetical protein H0H87_012873 [Tephrocybe sp. NHM501043]
MFLPSHLRAQMANIFHSVSSTFPTCACGEQARVCAICILERFVYGSEHPHDDHEKDDSERRMRERFHRHKDLELGPLIGAKHGFRTRNLVPGSGGLGGVVVWLYDDEEENERRTTREEIVETEDELELPSPDPRKHYSSHCAGLSHIHMPKGRPLNPPVDVRHAAAVPPKMRKGWMRQVSRDVDMA